MALFNDIDEGARLADHLRDLPFRGKVYEIRVRHGHVYVMDKETGGVVHNWYTVGDLEREIRDFFQFL